MRKILMLTVSALLASTINVSAGNHKGGFQNNNQQQMVTVTEIAELNDGDYVVMQGNILEKTGDDSYNFKDNTGTMIIEIDDEDWAGITVTPNDVVIIEG
ncbi:MAG: NirD/YgiW/YdeI family stress tolerance protein [Alphaproteobacteria bacterium]|nr:NirD/YgiW/YdeI family stress tolerance protein [Alphaproteobacteria bacterium]